MRSDGWIDPSTTMLISEAPAVFQELLMSPGWAVFDVEIDKLENGDTGIILHFRRVKGA